MILSQTFSEGQWLSSEGILSMTKITHRDVHALQEQIAQADEAATAVIIELSDEETSLVGGGPEVENNGEN